MEIKTDVTVTVVLAKHLRQNQDGRYPVKLRITYRMQRRYYSIDKYFFFENNQWYYQKEWDLIQGAKRGDSKRLKDKFDSIEVKARSIAESIEPVPPKEFFRKFKELVTNKPGEAVNTSVYDLFKSVINKFKIEERIGNAENYESALKSLQQFRKTLEFEEVTTDFLSDFEKWHLSKGNSPSTVGIYLRPLRFVFNEAIAQKLIAPEFYPFGRRKFQIPSARNVKKALDNSDLFKIFNYKTSNEWEAISRDLFIMSYLCSGINIKDICNLRYKDIDFDNEEISFVRFKTKRATKAYQTKIVLALSDKVLEIIQRHGTSSRNPENYIFNFFWPGITPEEERRVSRNLASDVNKRLKKIARKLDIDPKISTNYARHTAATKLRDGGATIEEIAEDLGHKDIRTTKIYLGLLKKEKRKKHADILSNLNE